MTSEANQNNIDYKKDLRDNLISIILDGDELLKLKALIKEMKAGKIEDIVLRKAILQFGENAVDRLISFIPFFTNLEDRKNGVREYTQLQKKLNEKEKILEKVNKKIDNIYKKLIDNHKEEK